MNDEENIKNACLELERFWRPFLEKHKCATAKGQLIIGMSLFNGILSDLELDEDAVNSILVQIKECWIVHK